MIIRGLSCFFLFLLSFAQAQIQTDGSLGPAQSLTGPDFVINEALGQRAGSNLFHSFSEFNLSEGESANFTGANEIANIISRVTGGNLSSINGLLKSDIANANLYLINPAGIVFGPNASLSINGSFHASTIDFIRLDDADLFYSEPLQGEILSTAAPKAFGFFGAPKGGITIDGSRLQVNDGEIISLIGGDLSLENRSRAIALSGQVNLVSVQSEGEALILNDSNDIDVSEFDVLGNISLVDKSAANAGSRFESELPAGRIVIRGNHLTLDNDGELRARNLGEGAGGSVDVLISGDMFIGKDSGIEISSPGRLGKISVEANSVTIDGTGKSAGQSGFTGFDVSQDSQERNIDPSETIVNLELTVAQTLNIINGGIVDLVTFGSGESANAVITTKNLTIDGEGDLTTFTGISSETHSESNGGSLDVTVTELLEIFDGGLIVVSTFGPGDGGTATIRAGDLTIDGRGTGTGIFSNTRGSGNAGSLLIEVDRSLKIVDDARIGSPTFGSGNAGTITVNATNLTIDGNGLYATIASFSDSDSTGNGGSIDVTVTELLEIVGGGLIDVSTFGFGDGGTAIIRAGNLAIDRQGSGYETGIISVSEGSGNGGNLFIETNENLRLFDGGEISASTYEIGNAGTIDIVGGSLYLSESYISSFSQTDQDVGLPAGNAGEINIKMTGDINIEGSLDSKDGPSISASSDVSNAGNLSISAGGDIRIANTSLSISAGQADFNLNDLDNFQQPELLVDAGDSIRIQNSTLSTNAGVLGSNSGAGGDIYLSAPIEIWLENSTLLAQAGYVGGNVYVDPIRYIVISSDVIAQADFQGGNYSVIVKNPSGWIQSTDSLINLSGEQSGSVLSNTSPFDLGAELSDLDTNLLNTEDWVSQPCKFRLGGGGSSFIITGWRGAFSKVDDFLPSDPILLADYELSETEPMAEESLRKAIFPEVDNDCENCP